VWVTLNEQNWISFGERRGTSSSAAGYRPTQRVLARLGVGQIKLPKWANSEYRNQIAALLTQRSVEEAARVSGVGTRTLLRWIKTPEFDKAYREARRATFTQSVARLQQATSAAATTLLKTMIDPGAPASVRIRAAESVLSHAAKAIEMEDLNARVAELERAAASTQGRTK
jgi:hypothetical protein